MKRLQSLQSSKVVAGLSERFTGAKLSAMNPKLMGRITEIPSQDFKAFVQESRQDLTPPLKRLSEEELVRAAKAGDELTFEVLLHRYDWLVRSRARRYFLQGADYEDLIQEGMIGLFKAVRDYRPECGSFRNFVELCVTRQIITAIKTASRQKHLPLNLACSLDAPRYFDEGRTLGETMPDGRGAFESALMELNEVKTIMSILRRQLSEAEYKILTLWLEGLSYEEVAKKIGKHTKAVDNGLWRVKCKIRKLLDQGVILRVHA